MDFMGMRTAAWELKQTEGGRDGQYGDGDGRLIKWEDTVAKINLGIEPNDPLDYSPRLELHHLTMGTLGSHGCQLERER